MGPRQWRQLSPTNPIDLANYPVSLTAADVELVIGPDPANPNKNVYVSSVPTLDPWGNPYEFYFNPDPNGGPTLPQVFAIRSAGANGLFNGTVYQRGSFDADDCSSDIVWADGNMR